MNIKRALLALLIMMFIASQAFNQELFKQNMTNWKIEASFKYDAICFLNIMTGDPFYLDYYREVYNEFKPHLTPVAENSLKNLKKILKDDNGRIVSAYLCLYFSAVEDSTMRQLILRLDNLDELKNNFEKTPYHNEESWKLFESTIPDLRIIFQYMQNIYFESYWKKNILPIIEKTISEIEPDLPKYDVIKENEEYLGFKLPSDEITVYMLYYSQPHGIKITGTRFLTDAAWPFNIVIRTAAHEMMHPPYDYDNNEKLRIAVESLSKDEFLMDKVENHNPSFGYNSLVGLFEEDCVQALDQLINEKLGVAKDAKKRWQESDDGIHVFAVALYQVMKEENYNAKNEVFADFLIRMIESGKLGAGKIKTWHDKFYIG